MRASSRSASTSSARRRSGFIPQQDRGYLIVAAQLPPGSSLDAHRRGDAAARSTLRSTRPASRTRSTSWAFPARPSPMRRTRARSSWCSTLFDQAREGSDAIGSRHPGRAVSATMPRSRKRFLIVVQPPPVQGIGNAGGFRMMVEDRAGRGPQALQAGGRRDDGQRARETPGPDAGVLAVRGLDAAALSRHRPHQGATARHQHAGRVQRRCRSISARPTSTTSTCSGAPSACRRRPMRNTASSRRDISGSAGAQFSGRNRAARLLHDRPRHYRTLPRAALQPLSGGRTRWRGGAGLLAGPGDRRSWRSLRPKRCPTASPMNGRRWRIQQIKAGNTAMFAFVAGGGVRVPGAGGAI